MEGWWIVAIAWSGALAMPFLRSHRAASSVAVLTAFSACLLLLTPADGLGVFLTLVAVIIGALAVIFSADYMRGSAEIGRYYALLLLFIGAMAGLVLSERLLPLLIFWEITALCSFALIAFHNDDPKAVAGGITALIVTQIGGVGLMGGLLLAQAALGTDEIAALLAQAHTLAPHTLSFIAFGFLLAAAAKSAQFPFHIWLPGAMEAPTPVSALIHAATMVNAGVYLLARFYPAFHAVPGWATSVALVGVLSALLGAAMALTATDLKRVLAYSTISQLGYMVYAVGVGALFASQFHLLSHAIFKALLFLAAGAVIHATGTRDLNRMGGLGAQMPLVRLTFVIGALALAGIPVLNGFWSKEYLLESGLHHGEAWMSAVMLFVAGLTALYTLRVVWRVFYGQPRSALHAHDAPSSMRFVLVALALAALTSGLLAAPLGVLLGTPAEDVLAEVLRAPSTLLTLLVTAGGFCLWVLRGSAHRFDALASIARSDFGFTWLTRQGVNITRQASDGLRTVQTGHLSWNLAAVLVTLTVLVALLMAGLLQGGMQ